MSAYPSMLGEFFLPILLMLAGLFLADAWLLQTPGRIDWMRRRLWLHPHRLSRYRYPMGAVSVLLWHLGFPRTALLVFTFGMLFGLAADELARRGEMRTEEGKAIDALADKLMYFPLLLYLAWRGGLPAGLVGLFLLLDVFGQVSRHLTGIQRSNLFGKAKTFLLTILVLVAGLTAIYGPLPLLGRAVQPLLVVCIALAFCSPAFKLIPNYWYANLISIMNLLCGLAACWVVLAGRPPVYAFGLVFLGQFLDLFDGRAAERWGSTPKGEIFDDVADGTSFGLAVGLIVAISFSPLWLGIALAVLHVGATVYRLIRFVVEKRRQGIPGGVSTFSGLPSPAGALLAGTACILIPGELLRGVLVAATALLMVSRVPYPHFGRAVIPAVPKLLRVLLLGGFLFLVALGVRRDDYFVPLLVAFAAILVYLVSPLYRLLKKPAAS